MATKKFKQNKKWYVNEDYGEHKQQLYWVHLRNVQESILKLELSKKSMFKKINGINLIWTLFNMKIYQKPCQSFDTYSFYVSMNQLKTNFKIQNKKSFIPTNHQWALKKNKQSNTWK